MIPEDDAWYMMLGAGYRSLLMDTYIHTYIHVRVCKKGDEIRALIYDIPIQYSPTHTPYRMSFCSFDL